MRWMVASLAVWSALAGTALADLKIVSDVTTEYRGGGVDSAPVHHTVTTWLQRDQARVEDDRGGVVLYDLKIGTVFRLDTKHQTYSVAGLGELPPPPAESTDLAMKLRGKTVAEIHVKPDTKTRTVAGLAASKTLVSADIDAEPVSVGGAGNPGEPELGAAGGGRLGGPMTRGGLSGIPFGGGGAYGGATPEPFTVQVQGDCWLASAAPATTAAPNVAWLPLLAEGLPETAVTVGLLPTLSGRLAGQGFPAASEFTVQFPHQVFIVRTEVQSITEAPLQRAMFYVPQGYRQSWPVPIISQ